MLCNMPTTMQQEPGQAVNAARIYYDVSCTLFHCEPAQSFDCHTAASFREEELHERWDATRFPDACSLHRTIARQSRHAAGEFDHQFICVFRLRSITRCMLSHLHAQQRLLVWRRVRLYRHRHGWHFCLAHRLGWNSNLLYRFRVFCLSLFRRRNQCFGKGFSGEYVSALSRELPTTFFALSHGGYHLCCRGCNTSAPSHSKFLLG